MAWERRGDSWFYYHPRRDGGRVVRDYFGAGALGQLAADLVAEAAQRRAEHAEAEQADRAKLKALEVGMGTLDEACEAVARATPLVAGRPEREDDAMDGSDGSGPDGGVAAGDLRALLGRAAGGDMDATAELRALLDGRPGAWERLGDLAAHLQAAWVGRVARANVALSEAIARRVGALRAELLEAGDTPAERLLAERVVATWLEVHAADLEAAGDLPPSGRASAMKWQEAAGRRHERAVEALARLRRPAPAAGVPVWGPGGAVHAPGVAEGGPAEVVPFAQARDGVPATRRPGRPGPGAPRRRARTSDEPGRA